MDDRKKGAEGTDDKGLNMILGLLDARVADNLAVNAAAFIRAQRTKLEDAEIVLRAARKALECGAYHNAAIHMINEYIGDRTEEAPNQTIIDALIELRRLTRSRG